MSASAIINTQGNMPKILVNRVLEDCLDANGDHDRNTMLIDLDFNQRSLDNKIFT